MGNEEENLELNLSNTSTPELDAPEEQPSRSEEDNDSMSGNMEDVTMPEETVPPKVDNASSLDLQVEDDDDEDEEEENVGRGSKQYNHNDDDQSPPLVAQQSTQAPGMVQVSALLRKNFLTKLRTPVATFFELFSPLLMMLILSAAYTLSEVQYRDAATYYSLTVDIPGPWLDLAAPALELLTGGGGIAGLAQRKRMLLSPITEMDEESSTFKEDLVKMKIPQWMEESSRQLMLKVQDLTSVPTRKLQESVDSIGNETSSPGNETGFNDFAANFDLLNDAIRQVGRAWIDGKGLTRSVRIMLLTVSSFYFFGR